MISLSRISIGATIIAFVGCGTPASPPVAAPPTEVQLGTAEDEAKMPAEPPAQPEEPPPVETPKIALQFQSWEEAQKVIGQQAGKIVVVDLWSTSCVPCLRELPHLVALQKQHGEKLVGITVSCDYVGIKKRPAESYREKVTEALAGLKAEGLTNIVCTDPADDLFAAVQLDSIPAVFVYDRTGKLAHRFDNRSGGGDEGVSYEKQVIPAIEKLLAE